MYKYHIYTSYYGKGCFTHELTYIYFK